MGHEYLEMPKVLKNLNTTVLDEVSKDSGGQLKVEVPENDGASLKWPPQAQQDKCSLSDTD